MKRRLLLIAGCLVLVLAVGYVVLRATGPNPNVTVENFRKLKVGQTGKEIEQLFGGIGQFWDLDKTDENLDAMGVEPDDDDPGESIGELAPFKVFAEDTVKVWVGPEVLVLVLFDDHGCLEFTSARRAISIGRWGKLRRLLGL